MKPKSIFLIRHSESIGNVNKSIYKHTPDYAVRITEKGKEQARAVGKELFRRIGNESMQFYVSTYFRTRETFQEIIKEAGSSECYVYYTPLTREQEWAGSLRVEGADMDSIQKERDEFGSFYYRFERGESCADVYTRISCFLDTMHRDFEKEDFPENVCLVLHGMSLRVLLMRWFHLSVEEFEVLKNPKNCCLIEMKLNQITGKYSLTEPLPVWDKPTHPYQLPI